MRSINLLVSVMTCMLIMGCGKDQESQISRESSPQLPEKLKDIHQLPLDQALKAKYEKLIFKCDYKMRLKRPDAVGGSSFTTLEKQFYVWDLLKDFTKRADLEIEYKFENVHTRIQWAVELSMVDRVEMAVENTKNSYYQLTDAVLLKGSSLTEVKEYGENGAELGSSEIHINQKSYFDRVNEQVTSSEFNFTEQENNSTYFDLNCVIDAKVKPGYESDFKVVKN